MPLVDTKDWKYPSLVPLPDSPSDPLWTEVLREIANADDGGMADFRFWCTQSFWFFNRFCLSFGQLLCGEPDNPHFGKPWPDHPWIFARCQELQRDPDNQFHQWPRNSFKSALITQNLTMWEWIRDVQPPQEGTSLRTLILTYKKDRTGEAFLAMVKREVETNELLRLHWPDLFYPDPKQSGEWGAGGLRIKQRGNPREATLSVSGLDSMPTSQHFDRIIFDDPVVRETVRTPEQIQSTVEAMRQATFLRSDDTRVRYVGTRWKIGDPWEHWTRQGLFRTNHHSCYDKNGAPTLRSRKHLEDFRQAAGPYEFCLAADQRILMADWSHKNIEDVEIGDKVVGLVPGVRARRVHLIETEVTAKTVKLLEMYEYGTAEGGVVKCTPDHKWWTGRNGNDFHRAYAPLGKLTNGSTLRRVISLVEPAALSRERSIVAGYLGGIFDGEGGFSGIRVNEGVGGGGTVHISQTEGRNSVVCERIRESFDALDLPYSAHHPKTRAGWSQRVQFYLRGGRQKRYEFLRYCNPAKQRDKIIKSLMGSCSGKHGYSLSKKENVTSWRSLGVRPAYSITTGTGNYIAEGYVSKNSAQMIGNPIADSDKRFELGWLRFFEREPDEERIGKNVYILVDPARSQKKGSDYTVVWVIGLGPDRNYYCLDLYRERLNVPDFLDLLFDLVTIWRPIKVFEEVFGAQRDVEHIRERQKLLGYRFDIDEVPEVRTPKEERIEALMVPMADGRFWFPKGGYGHTAKGDHRDALTVFKEDEYEFWTPAGTTMHDDMLDCLGFLILDKMKAQLRWPVRKVSDSYDRGRKLGRVSRRGVSGERTAWSW